MVDDPAEGLLTAAADVLDEAALARLAGSLRAADPPTRYRRLVEELNRLGRHDPAGPSMAEFLAGDAVVLARMAVAVAVMHGAGAEVDVSGDAADHLRRAVSWRVRASGAGPEWQRSCAADIARGSLRLWSLSGGVAHGPVSPHAALTRSQLAARARRTCRDLRAELAIETARLTRRGIGAYEARVRAEVCRVAVEFDAAIGDVSGPVVEAALPLRRPLRLENRLAALLGAGFGVSVSLTVARVVADLRPQWTGGAAVACAILGLALTSWVVLARRLITERAAAERWTAEVVAALRGALEERVLTWAAPPSVPAGRAADPVSDRGHPPVGHTPRLTAQVRPALTFNQDDGSLRD